MRWRTLVAAITLGATSLTPTGAAWAAGGCFPDTEGDAEDARADIVEHCVSSDGTKIMVAVKFRQHTAPSLDPAAWGNGTAVLWELRWGDGDMAAVFLDRVGAHVSDAATGATYPATAANAGDRLTVTFDASHIGEPVAVTLETSIEFYATDDGAFDAAPDDGTDGPVTLGQPSAPLDPVTRIAGADRVDTAVRASEAAFASDAGAVVLASASGYADALVGVPLAARHDGPVLLTPGDLLWGEVSDEIERLLPSDGPMTVYLLGGPAALAPGIEAGLRDAGYTTVRYGGSDRYETAALVAAALGSPSVVFEATGRDFPDALAAGAAAAKAGGAVLLTDGPVQSPATSRFLAAHPGVTRVAVGGAAAKADPGATALAGADRYDTAARVAQHFFPAPASVGVASGVNYPDALAGGAHAASVDAPLLLVAPTVLPPATAGYLTARKAPIATGWLYGGPAAVAESVRTAVRQAIT